MSGIMTGSNFGTHFPGFPDVNMEKPTDIGALFGAISIDSFIDIADFKSQMDRPIREVIGCPLAEGVERIHIPGEKEIETRKKRLAKGIPIPEPVVNEFISIGNKLGVPFP